MVCTMTRFLSSQLCPVASVLLALLLAWRDLRTRQLPDRELALFTFFTFLPHLLTDHSPTCGSWPLWLIQALV
ncbi:MAG: hypothetical protein GX838_04510, partial [Clostridiaceae bacterium]|nr:hypothetical protein [Clostridiaceae bacterium]